MNGTLATLLTPDFTPLPTVLATLLILEPCNEKEREWSKTINMDLTVFQKFSAELDWDYFVLLHVFKYLVKSQKIVLNEKIICTYEFDT